MATRDEQRREALELSNVYDDAKCDCLEPDMAIGHCKAAGLRAVAKHARSGVAFGLLDQIGAERDSAVAGIDYLRARLGAALGRTSAETAALTPAELADRVEALRRDRDLVQAERDAIASERDSVRAAFGKYLAVDPGEPKTDPVPKLRELLAKARADVDGCDAEIIATDWSEALHRIDEARFRLGKLEAALRALEAQQ